MSDDEKTITNWMDEFGFTSERQIPECLSRVRFALGSIRYERWLKREIVRFRDIAIASLRPPDGLTGSITTGAWEPFKGAEEVKERFRSFR